MDTIVPEIADQQKIAADVAQPLELRLETYEDIIDSEVGDTYLVRARNIEREINFRQLYLKFKGGNPTGTQKDRIAFAQAMGAVRRGFETITLATCGNYGVAMAMAAAMAGLRCLIYVPANYHTRRLSEIEQFGAHVERAPGDYEAAVDFSSRVAQENEYCNANPGSDNTDIQLRAYGQIAYQI